MDRRMPRKVSSIHNSYLFLWEKPWLWNHANLSVTTISTLNIYNFSEPWLFLIYTTRRINPTLQACGAMKCLVYGGHPMNISFLPFLFPPLPLLLQETFCSSLNYPLFVIISFIVVTNSTTIPMSTSQNCVHLYLLKNCFLSRCQQE